MQVQRCCIVAVQMYALMVGMYVWMFMQRDLLLDVYCIRWQLRIGGHTETQYL